jgi:hypothetical protein
MDMCTAIILWKTTGDAESLTIVEFGTRVSDIAARAFREAEAIKDAAQKPVRPKRGSGQSVDDR